MIDQQTEFNIAPGTAPMKENGNAPAQLFVPSEAQELRIKWEKIQTGFVDEPRKAVQDIALHVFWCISAHLGTSGWPKSSPVSCALFRYA